MNPKTRQTALRLLARREHSQHELTQKLTQRGYTPQDIHTVIEDLKKSTLQSDHRFAESFTRSRQTRGQGPLRIILELKARHIPHEIIEEVINITDNAWFTLARDAWRRHFKGRIPNTPAERAKQTRFLHYRGFTQDHINHLIKDGYEYENQHAD